MSFYIDPHKFCCEISRGRIASAVSTGPAPHAAGPIIFASTCQEVAAPYHQTPMPAEMGLRKKEASFPSRKERPCAEAMASRKMLGPRV